MAKFPDRKSETMAIEKTPEGTYGTREPGKLGRALFEAFTQRSIAAYRRTGGTNWAARMMGFRW